MTTISACIVHRIWQNGDDTFSAHVVDQRDHHTLLASGDMATRLIEASLGTETGEVVLDLEVDGSTVAAMKRTKIAFGN